MWVGRSLLGRARLRLPGDKQAQHGVPRGKRVFGSFGEGAPQSIIW